MSYDISSFEDPGASDPTGPQSGIGPAVVRTIVPMLVTLLTSWAARKGFEIDDATRSALVGLVSLLVGSGYYIAVRELERVNPKLGWLLGSPHAPVYPTKNQPAPAEPVDPGLTLPLGGTDPVEGP